MKTLFIITFISLFSIQTYAQKSQYFLIKEDSSEIVPKDLHLPEITGPSDNSVTLKGNLKPLMDSCSLFLNEAFDGIELNTEDLKAFHHTTFSFIFDKDGKMIYYRYTVIGSKYTKDILKWEKRLYKFAQKMKSLNLKPYIEIRDESLFKRGSFNIGELGRKFQNKNREQISSYFIIEKSKSDTILYLKPKDLVLKEIDSSHDNRYWFINPKEMKIVLDSLIQQSFEGLNLKDICLLDHLNFVAYFDNQYNLIYYQYYFPKKHADKLKKIDKQLYKFIQMLRQIDIKSYVKIHNEKSFKQASFGIINFKDKYENKYSNKPIIQKYQN